MLLVLDASRNQASKLATDSMGTVNWKTYRSGRTPLVEPPSPRPHMQVAPERTIELKSSREMVHVEN